MKINEQMLKKMREATQALMSDGPTAATAAIQKALHQKTNASQGMSPLDLKDYFSQQMPNMAFTAVPEFDGVIDITAKEVKEDVSYKGQFITGSYTNSAGSRQYKLYVPSTYDGKPLPLIVMLHGCTQNPDDFAAGTRMNMLAEEQPCLVLYPAQSQAANSSKCWNWFNAIDQQRDQGEPSIIAGVTREIMKTHAVDESRVYVTGLSAGGAMAVIMGTLYPDLYTAVGVHSGLPHAAAHDLPSALMAMSGKGSGPLGANVSKSFYTTRNARVDAIPIIVFHGDKDSTVHPSNAEAVMKENVPVSASSEKNDDADIRRGQVPNGHTYTQTTFSNDKGEVMAECWLIHGAGHAWSGGSKQGSYTDIKGPDASREMMRFFLSHSKTQ